MNIPKSPLQLEIDKHSLAAREPRCKFVEFLTLLCAGILGLSAPLESFYSTDHRPALLLSLFALILLAVSVVLGAVALYGESHIHEARVDEIENALKKHNQDETLALQDIRKGIVLRPSPAYRWVFRIQCITSALAVLLLVWSKAVPGFRESRNTHLQRSAVHLVSPAGSTPVQTNATRP